MRLADKIVRLRKTNGMSQESLAEKLNVSRQAVSRWEMGSAMPDAANVLQISKLFGVTTDYLLNDDYESDEDLPKIKEAKEDHFKQLLFYMVMLEVMILLMQFMTTVILRNVFFALLSFIPFAALIGGFEYAYQKRKEEANERTIFFRKRFYKISAWTGLYFPVRLFVTAVMELCSRMYPVLVAECMILSIYIAAAFLVNLSLDKKREP